MSFLRGRGRLRRGRRRREDGPLDLTADLLEHWYLALVGVPPLHAYEYVLEPGRSLPAGGALPAALVLVKVGEAADGPDHVDGVVEHGDRGRAEAGPLGAEVVELHQRLVALGLVEYGDGRSPGDASPEAVPPVPHPPAVLLDQLTQRNGHALLHDDGVLHVSRDGEELRAAVVGVAESREP